MEIECNGLGFLIMVNFENFDYFYVDEILIGIKYDNDIVMYFFRIKSTNFCILTQS